MYTGILLIYCLCSENMCTLTVYKLILVIVRANMIADSVCVCLCVCMCVCVCACVCVCMHVYVSVCVMNVFVMYVCVPECVNVSVCVCVCVRACWCVSKSVCAPCVCLWCLSVFHFAVFYVSLLLTSFSCVQITDTTLAHLASHCHLISALVSLPQCVCLSFLKLCISGI